MSRNQKQRGLGRGLSALMADVTTEETPSTQSPRRADLVVPVEKITPNPEQPRRQFTEEQLNDLAASIREKGVIQPLIVRPKPGADGEYEIVAGERRWRASQMAQLHELPVIVREYSDTEALEVAIIENIQRADLNAIEEAAGYRDLMNRFGHTQEKVSEALGKSRSHIANLLRLLNLPDEVQDFVRDGKLSAGHARTLVTADNPVELARQIIAKGLSVRAAEALAKSPKPNASRPPRQKAEKDADTRALEGDLSAALGMNVQIDHAAGGESGTVSVRYASLDDLDTLCGKLSS
ncbi:chromosome segregation DNA-binding protein [Aliiroseovarius sediminilitoris]|uniref:Chromosome segregation DNA-binding protein n=1 Tax=Aliiroseovarius sediminilitoris TaxID=1173584 RepID=A0A1I0MS52_9RHOB|nr:ParB/RepB/Spo0J family partition protein [Aliiroseovarius sediminilitoris]SEV91517.1 chromosome segregation DNA-binding protein [Aliiroseovarius sediminilitoris]